MLGRRSTAIASFQHLVANGYGESVQDELARLLAIPS